MATFDELKSKMKDAMIEAETKVLEGKTPPTRYQEIPALFEGWNEKASKAIRGAMWISKKYNLIPPDTPLRSLWYKFIKLVFQKIHPSKKVSNPTHSFYKSLADIMRRTEYWYRDFNIYNKLSKDIFQRPNRYWTAEEGEPSVILFPNVLITLEKESYFHTFQNFCDLLGINLYAAGGMPSLSKAEEASRQLRELNTTDDLNLYTLSDYDPAGFNINETFKNQFSEFLDRFGQKVNNIKVAPFPNQYNPQELREGSYVVKPNTIQQERWNEPERIQERIETDLIDHRFLDPDFYSLEKDSEIKNVLMEGELDKKKHTAWIKEWKEKVEKGAQPHILGLEVESLPDEPFPEQMPRDMDIDEAVGNARMRFIVFDKLLEDFDIKDSLKIFMKKYFIEYPSSEAWSILKRKADFERLNDLKYEIERKIDNLITVQSNVLREDKNELESIIEEWRDNIIENLRDNDDLIDKFEQSLRKAIAENEKQVSFKDGFDFPDFPDSINDFEASDDTKKIIEERIVENSDFINDLLRQLDEQIDIYKED